MNISICIPTIKSKEDIQGLVDELQESIEYTNSSIRSDCNLPMKVIEILPSCNKVSASINRNWCIEKAAGDIIIMIDDDVSIVDKSWIVKLVAPLIVHKENISIIAPRLTNKKLVPAPQLGIDGWYDYKPSLKIACHSPKTKLNVVCSACIAFFKSNGVLFDEDYPDACYEDTDFCMRINEKFPNKRIIINQASNLAHLNESKWRAGGTWHHNKALFAKKWGIEI